MRDIFHEYQLNRQLLVLAHCTALMLATKTIEEEKLAVGNEYFFSTEPWLATLKCWSLLWCARTKIKLSQKENSVKMKCDGSDVDKYSPAVPWDLWKNQHQTCKIFKNYRKNVDRPTWWPNTPELQESHKPRPHLCSRRLVALGKKFWNFNLDLIQIHSCRASHKIVWNFKLHNLNTTHTYVAVKSTNFKLSFTQNVKNYVEISWSQSWLISRILLDHVGQWPYGRQGHRTTHHPSPNICQPKRALEMDPAVVIPLLIVNLRPIWKKNTSIQNIIVTILAWLTILSSAL